MSPVSATVVAIDSGSRSASAPSAYARVAEHVAQLASRDVLYKTVDSTLRGHVKVELEAAFAASGRKQLVFAPAFPAAGRTTVDGIQLVHGVPVAETDYGRDPVHPALHSCLLDLVPPTIEQVVCLDAWTQNDLDVQVAALPDPEKILWVGSPGLARALARRFVPDTTTRVPFAPSAGDILVAIGSANLVSHQQADRLVTEIGVTTLRSPRERARNPSVLLDDLASSAANFLRDPRFSSLIATGGDTMEAILEALGVETFEIIGEIEAGFPLGRAALGEGRTLLIGMKAGGFGDASTLQRAVEFLREKPSNPGHLKT